MKNKEKYAREIVETAINGRHIAFDKTNNRVVPCNSILCAECLFHREESCLLATEAWANAEYKEPRQFTVREKAFINLFPEIQYIAREKGGKLIAYLEKPSKNKKLGGWLCGISPYSFFEIRLGDFLQFESIQWEDEEPTSREEILEGQKMNNDELKKDILSIVKGAMLEADELPFIETTEYIADALIAGGLKFDTVVSHEEILGSKEKDGD